MNSIVSQRSIPHFIKNNRGQITSFNIILFTPVSMWNNISMRITKPTWESNIRPIKSQF